MKEKHVQIEENGDETTTMVRITNIAGANKGEDGRAVEQFVEETRRRDGALVRRVRIKKDAQGRVLKRTTEDFVAPEQLTTEKHQQQQLGAREQEEAEKKNKKQEEMGENEANKTVAEVFVLA